MQLKRIFLICLFNVFSSWVLASDINLKSNGSAQNSYLGASYEFSKFSTSDDFIQGSGIKMNGLHFFNPSLSSEVFFSAALNQNQNIQNSFTGFGGHLYYTVFGNGYNQTQTVSLNEMPYLTVYKPKTDTLLVGGGINQYFLNGSRGVYSASGLTLAANYTFNMFGFDLQAGVKYSLMSAAGEKLTGIFGSFGILINL